MAGHLHGTWNVSQHLAIRLLSPSFQGLWRNCNGKDWKKLEKNGDNMDIELRRAAQVKSTEVKLSLHLLAISPAIDVLPAEDQRGPSQRMKLAASPASAYHCIIVFILYVNSFVWLTCFPKPGGLLPKPEPKTVTGLIWSHMVSLCYELFSIIIIILVNCQRLTVISEESWSADTALTTRRHTPPRAAWAAARAAKGAPGSFSGMDRSLREMPHESTWDILRHIMMTQGSTWINIRINADQGNLGTTMNHHHEPPPWHPWLKIPQDLGNQNLVSSFKYSNYITVIFRHFVCFSATQGLFVRKQWSMMASSKSLTRRWLRQLDVVWFTARRAQSIRRQFELRALRGLPEGTKCK